MRNPPASEVLNEEIANLLKKKINASITCRDELGISFDYAGEVTRGRGVDSGKDRDSSSASAYGCRDNRKF